VKIGIQSAFGTATPPDLIADFGRIVEERGFHSIWVPEHVVFFPEYASRYPYSRDGKIPGSPDGVMEPLTALTFLAAHTERVRLGTGVCLVPQRNPLYTARQVADLDFLSRGRLDFGIGVGWLREEFEALGVPWERRGARTRECVAVMKTLWCDEVSSFEGDFYSLPACLHNPKPVQKPHPPLYFGGESEAALRRVAELGQGWFGFDMTPDELTAHLARLDELLAAAGRSRDDVKIQVSPRGQRLEAGMLEAFRGQGVDQVIVPLFSRDADGLRRRADALAEQLLP
jgi:probable F420-dependent oxidoreductase